MAPQVSNSSFTNYYDVLHLPRDATRSQIRLRFKKLSLLFHPDKNKDEDAPRIFRSLKTAEEILGDPNKKAQFDRQLNEIDDFLKGGTARAAAAEAARAAAARDTENRARDQRHYDRDQTRSEQHHHDHRNYEDPYAPPKRKPPRPREEIYMMPQYKPTGRQPP